ncbi:LOW QUALITY PROTEIN: E3 ubiquitin-protein ligase TRIM45 [Acridotheres tristis]
MQGFTDVGLSKPALSSIPTSQVPVNENSHQLVPVGSRREARPPCPALVEVSPLSLICAESSAVIRRKNYQGLKAHRGCRGQCQRRGAAGPSLRASVRETRTKGAARSSPAAFAGGGAAERAAAGSPSSPRPSQCGSSRGGRCQDGERLRGVGWWCSRRECSAECEGSRWLPACRHSRCAQPCVSPRLLPCLHSLCEPCLRRLGPPEGLPGATRPVLCPVCDAEVSLPAGGVGQLPRNCLAGSRARAGGCDLCADGAAAGRCLTCGVCLCRFCCRAHRRQKKTAFHAVTELENTNDCSQAGKPLLCPSHPTEELQLFCEQCDQPVYWECILGRQVSSVTHKHRDALRELLKSSQQHMNTLEDVLSQVDEMGSQAEAVATEICLFARGYVKAIEEHDRPLKQLEDLKVQKENLLHLQKAQLQQLLLDMRTGVEFTEHLLMSRSDVEILLTEGVVSSRLRKLNSTAYSIHPSVDDRIQFSPYENAGQCCGYEVFGAILNEVVDPARCTLHGEDLHSARQNQLSSFTLLCKETTGECMGGEAVWVTITHKDKRTVKPTVFDNGDGTYCISYSPEEPGLYAVCICVKGQHEQVAFLVSHALFLLYMFFFCSPFTLMVEHKFREHGVFHCCTFCSSGGQKSAHCACGATMPGGYQGYGHEHKGHPGCYHWSCCGHVRESSECLSVSPSDTSQRSLLRTVAL